MTSLHDFECVAIDGSAHALSQYAGKLVLVVNVASECGLTPQYAGLQELYETYGERGLVVLGFPCNQFAGQEPGDEAAIQSFCSATYGVSFPLFSKLEVNGAGRHPLFAWLATQESQPEGAGDIGWNFGKFLVGPDGALIARYAPPTTPAELAAAIEAALA